MQYIQTEKIYKLPIYKEICLGTMYSGGLGGIGLDINQQFFHFVSPDDNSQSVLRSHKQIPEIFLTRLLSTKVEIILKR